MERTRYLDQMGDAARELLASPDDTARRQQAVDQAVALVDACDFAGLTLVDNGQVSTGAATDDIVWQGDKAQYDLSEGPCLDSVRDEHTVICQDLTQDRRWPKWSPYVVEHLGVHSMVALLLFTRDRSYGALNLYSTRTEAFTTDDIMTAEALAAAIAVSLASAAELKNRGTAMVNRTVIGQAQGILMERYDVSSAAAFALLQQLSQSGNIKLATLADTLVATRTLPGLPESASDIS